MTCAADCPDCPADAPQGDPLVVPHELHVTVSPPEGADTARWVQLCEAIGVHPVVMTVIGADGTSHTQAMTASSVVGTDAEARVALARMGDKLAFYGWDPVRAKIEAAPWHPGAVLQAWNEGLPDGAYWESHIGLWIRPVQLDSPLRQQVHQLNGYLSRNELRPARADGAERWSLSIRSQFMSRKNQESQVAFVHDIMLERGLKPDRPRTEYTWFDACLDPSMAGGPPFGTQVPRSILTGGE